MNDCESSTRVASACRYAAFLAPSLDSAWWRAGSRWLGRDAASETALVQPALQGISTSDQQRLTSAPRRYGWHATLKAPFALASSIELSTLRSGLDHICQVWAPFTMASLEVVLLDDFLVLAPHGDASAVNALAGACVTGLHAFAAPLSPGELARRRSVGLSAEEDALLVRWGYPFVLSRFRFHFTLTGSLRNTSPETILALEAAAAQWFGALPPCRFEAVSLFVEPRPDADFVCMEQIRLGL